MKQQVDWNKIKSDIIDKTNIETEYRSFGVIIASSTPNTEGWLTCKIFGDADDRNPSAGININTGEYHNFRDGEHLSFFDFAFQKANRFSDYKYSILI